MVLIQNKGYSYMKKKLGHRQAQRQDHVKTQKDSGHLQGKEWNFRRNQSCWKPTSSLQNCEEINFCCWSHLVNTQWYVSKPNTLRKLKLYIEADFDQMITQRIPNLEFWLGAWRSQKRFCDLEGRPRRFFLGKRHSTKMGRKKLNRVRSARGGGGIFQAGDPVCAKVSCRGIRGTKSSQCDWEQRGS